MEQALLFTTLAIFPFGQIFKIGDLLFLDVIIGAVALFTLFTAKKYPTWYKYFVYFIIFALFSWIFNYFVIQNIFILKSFLYLVRLFIYSLIPVFVSNQKNKSNVISYMLAISVVIATFGFLQYLFLPDLRSLKILNWDDHYFRLVGTFLDPGFTAIILVLGAILALCKRKYSWFIFLGLSILFTYSRAGYLALFVSLFYYFFKTKKIKTFVLLATCFMLLATLLPSGQGEGQKLTRTSTILARLTNYKQSIEIIKKSPVLGVGYNNICAVKNENTDSHSCFGLDNSFLFILATTGVVGLILFVSWGLSVMSLFSHSTYYVLLATSTLSVLIASMFANAIFYPHIMVWLGILLGLRSEVETKRS